MAPTKEEVIAIKTASPSPRNPKLRFNGNGILICIGCALNAEGSAIAAPTNDTDTSNNARRKRRFLEMAERNDRATKEATL